MNRLLLGMLVAFALWVATASTAQAQVISQPPVLVNPTCPGDANGSIRFLLPSDPNDYLFDWSGGNAATGLTVGLFEQTGLEGATYTVYILNVITLFDTTISVTLIEPAPILVSAGVDVRACVGQALRLNGSASAPGTFTWSYTDGSGTPRTLSGNSPTIPGSGAGSLNQNTSTRVTLIVTTAGGCAGTDTVSIRISPIPVATFTFDNSAICIGQNVNVTFTGTASVDAVYSWILVGGGGVFTANGLATITGAGPHQIRFTSPGTGTPPLRSVLLRVTEPTSGGGSSCQANRSGTIIVQAPPALSVTGLSPVYCITADPVALVPNPVGGTFRGPGMVGNVFDPALAGVGTHRIRYIFSTSLGCTDSVEVSTQVVNNPTATIAGLNAEYCQGSPSVSLTLSPVGGTLIGSGTRLPNLFFPDSATVGSIRIRYAVQDTNGCIDTASATTSIKITPRITVNPDSSGICSGGQTNIQLTSTSTGATFTYTALPDLGVLGAASGSGNSINQTLTGAGSVSYFASASLNGCTSPNRRSLVTVTARPTVTGLPASQTICSGSDAVVSFTGSQPNITYTWVVQTASAGINGPLSGSGDTLRGTFTNTTSTLGSVTYLVTPTASGCVGTPIIIEISVQPAPNVLIVSADTNLCGSDSVRITVSGSVSGTAFSFTPTLEQGTATGFAPFTGTRLAQRITATDSAVAIIAYQIRPSVGSCPGSPITVRARVFPIPSVRNLPDTLRFCSGTLFAQALASTPLGSAFSWTPFTVSGSITGASSGSGNVLAGNLAGTGVTGYSIRPTLGTCQGLADTLYVRTNQKPEITSTPLAPVICSGNTTGITLSSNVPATIFWRSVSNAGVIGARSGNGTSINDTLLNATTTAQTQVYRVWATAGGCTSDTISVDVQVRQPLLLTSVPTAPIACSGDSIRIELSASPSAGTTYGWRMQAGAGVSGLQNGTGSTIRFAPIHTDSTPSTITIRAGAQGLCTADSLTILVGVKPRARITATTPSPVCSGDTVRLLTRVVPQSSTLSYTVSADATLSGLAGGSILPIRQRANGAGAYTFTFRANLDGCQDSLTVTGTVNGLPTKPTITSSGPLTLCQGASVTLSTTSPEGLQWLKDGMPVNAPVGNLAALVVSQAGVYRILARNPAGCADTSDAITVSESPSPPQPIISGDSGFCATGSASLTSTPFTTYQWLLNGLPVLGETNQTFINITTAGNYQVIGFNVSGCSDTSTVFAVIARPAPAQPTITGPNLICPNDSIILSTSSVGTLQWFSSTTPIVGATADTLKVGTAGNYAVSITDRFGCSNLSALFTLSNRPVLPTPVLSGNNLICAGDSTTLISSITDEAFTYEWELDGVLFPGSQPSIRTPFVGLYRLQISQSGFCTVASDTFRVQAAPAPTRPVISGILAFCTGSSTTLSSSVANSYAWVRNGSPISGATSQTLSVGQPGAYSLTITNSLDCKAVSDTVTVVEWSTPSATTSTTPTSACGVADGSIILTIAGGSGRFEFTWTGTGVSPKTQNQVNLLAGLYSVVVRDSATNCSISLANIEVVDTSLFPATATATQASTCNSNTGAITLILDAADGPFSFSWTGTGNGISPLSQNQPNLSVGTYSVVITQTATGCARTISGITVQAPTPVRPLLSGRLSLCGGASTVLRSSATGNNRWFFNNAQIAGALADTLLVTTLGDYFVVDSSNGCAGISDTITVINSTPPVAPTLSGDTTYCTNASGLLTASGTVSTWLLNGVPTVLSGTTITTTTFGAYQAVVQDANGCADTSLAFVTSPITFSLAVTTTPPTACGLQNGIARVTYNTGGLPATVSWKNSAGATLATNQDTLDGLAPGLYKVVVQTATCIDSADFVIAVPAGFIASATATKASCGLADASATATVVGGVNPTFTWYRVLAGNVLDSLTTGSVVNGLNSGSYTVIASEGICRDTTTFIVQDTLQFVAAIRRNADGCGGISQGLARVTSPSPLTAITWKNASNTIVSTLDSLVAGVGTYNVVVTSGACADSSTVTIFLGPPPSLTANATPASTCTGNDGTLSASFGVGASYQWFRIEGGLRISIGTTASIPNAIWGSYRVIAQAGTCIDSATVIVTRPANCGSACGIRLTVASNPVTCQGGANGEVIALITTGASGFYQFRINGAGAWLVSDSAYQRFLGLGAGSYFVEVRDRLDTACTTSATQTIGTRVTLSLLAQVDNGTCGSTTGALRIRVAGGAAPYRVSIDGGTTFISIINPFGDTTLAGQTGGTYPLVVEDATPCRTAPQNITIAPRGRIRARVSSIPVTCFAGLSGGFRVDTVLGGTGPYTYRVNGNTVPAALVLNQNYTGFAAGNNTLFITDVTTNCTWDTTFVIQAPARIVTNISTLQQPGCGASNGVIRITSTTGGSAPYLYILKYASGAILSGPIAAGDSLRSSLGEGTYTLVTRDTLGCADSTIFRLSTVPQALVVTVSPGNIRVCPGQAVIFRGSTNLAVPNPLYQWFVNATPIAGATVDTLAINTLQPGDTVRLEVRSLTAPLCITGLPAWSAPSLVDVVSGQIAAEVTLIPDSIILCPNTPARFTARNVNRIANAQFAFHVNGIAIQTGSDSTFVVANPADQDRVYVVMTTLTGATCVNPAFDTSNISRIQVRTAIVATATVTANDSVTCQGSALVLSVSSNLSYVPGYSIQWLRNGNPVLGATSPTYPAVDGAGRYSYQAVVRITPVAGCITNVPDTSAPVFIRFRASTDPRCRPCQVRLTTDTVIGASCAAFFNGQIRLAASGGSGRYSYGMLVRDTVRNWQTSPLFAGLQVASYGFVVRDSANLACADTLLAVVVPARTNLNATVVVTRLTACTTTPNGRIEIRNVTGGFGPFRYKIRTADILASANIYTGLSGGTYSITVQDDSTRCQFFTLVRVDTTPTLRAFASAARGVTCYGGSDGSVRIDSVKNGNGGYSYSLLRPDTGFVAFIPGVTRIDGFRAGSYTFFVRDGSRCVSTVTVTVRQPDSLRIAVANPTQSECSAPTGTLKITSFGGGTGNRTYTLLRPGSVRADTIPFPFADSTLRNLTGGDYVLSIVDSSGCSKSVAFRIPSDAPTIGRIAVQGNCPGGANGVITLQNISGGRRPYTFELSRADGFIRTQADSVFRQLTPGVYTITVSDSSLPVCVSRYTRTLNVLDSLKARLVRYVPSTCASLDGEAVYVLSGGVKPFRFAYDSVAGSFTGFKTLSTDTLHLRNLTARPLGILHQIQLQDSADGGGCAASFSFQMPGNTPVTYTIGTKDIPCFGDYSGAFILTEVKGTGPLRVDVYNTRDGALVRSDSLRDAYLTGSTFTVTNLPAGSFNVQIAQYGACRASRTETIALSQPPRIELYYRNTVPSTPDFAEGEIELDSVNGGVNPYQIRIGEDGVSQDYTPAIFLNKLMPGPLNVYIADSNGCRVTREMIVGLDSAVTQTNLFTPNNDGMNDTWVVKNLPKGSKVRVYSRWGRQVFEATDYQNNWTADGVPSGIYTYTITPPTGPVLKGWVEINRAEGRQ